MEMISRGKRHVEKHSRSSSQFSGSTFSSRSTKVTRSPFTLENKEEEEKIRKRLLSRTLPDNEPAKNFQPEAEEYGPKPPVFFDNF